MQHHVNYTMLTDFYELTMGNGYFQTGVADQICYFDIFFRSVPDGGGFAIAAGLEQVISYIRDLHFDEEDIAYLRSKNTFSEEFLEYPLLTFYDNGYIEAGWSQSQGLSGADFQPYTLYQYDSGSDTYVAAAQVDAWERSVSETDEEGNGFPEEIDAGGAGIVYYITPDGEEPGEPVDQAEYEAWTASWRGEAREMEIHWMKLTEEKEMRWLELSC